MTVEKLFSKWCRSDSGAGPPNWFAGSVAGDLAALDHQLPIDPDLFDTQWKAHEGPRESRGL